MPLDSNHLETLKYILDNSLHPENLDAHPWTKSLIVLDAAKSGPDISSGQQLVTVIEKLFAGMMPSAAPRRGKRLDTHWGEFGILAAQYFAPLKFGAPSPASLRDAWGRMDQSILLYVYGKSEDALSTAEKEKYKLVGDELEVAPNSTLSDWHRKGLQRLTDAILARETYLSKTMPAPSVILHGESPASRADDAASSLDSKNKTKPRKSGARRFILPLLFLILLVLLLMGGLKARKIYDMAMRLRQDAAHIQEVGTAPDVPRLERVKNVGPALAALRQDFDALKTETAPFLWLGPWLNWVPQYGGDLASIQDLAATADSLLVVADLSYQAVLPIVQEKGLSPARLTELLNQAQPQLVKAQQALEDAQAARGRLTPDSLSPRVRALILNDVDPLLALVQDGLTFGVEFPILMGASSEGPKTYLLLVENEDELRPTGGFITAAGTLLIQDGRVTNLTFANSGDFDNWAIPYPAAPWQLSDYMNSRVLIFRDANWFTNYPTAALYAEYLYSYFNDHSVDGVIAFNQQALVEMLGVIGPLDVEGVDYPIDASNVVAYMRASKTPTAEERASPDWNNKIFINKITRALITKLFSGDVEWDALSTVLLQILNEHHLLLQLDSPDMTSLLSRYHWDGTLQPVEGEDFLMAVNSNIGFNKTNAVVESNMVYDVDLTKTLSPTALLTVENKNNSVGITACKHWDKVRAVGEEDYPIQDCYWDYLRVYTAKGTILLDATPQSVPAEWMILNQPPHAQVDTLDEEIDGVKVFGTLQVVPAGESISTSFRFALPANIVQVRAESGQSVYHLKLQKQPGAVATPIAIQVHLPNNAAIVTLPAGAVVDGHDITFQANLRTDLEFEVVYQIP